jgi:hypothetical protein
LTVVAPCSASPLGDHLITPQNAALVLIEDRPSKFAAVRSMNPDLLLENIVSTVKLASLFELPIAFKLQCLLAPAGQGAH